MENNKPNRSDSTDTRAEAHNTIYEWLRENRSWVFDPARGVPCAVHKRNCPAHPQFSPKSNRPPVAESNRPLLKRKATVIDLEDDDKIEASKRAHVNMASPPCTPFSLLGAVSYDAHDDDIAGSIWCLEREAWGEKGCETMALFENVPNYLIERTKKRLTGHSVYHVVDGPQFKGHPSKRARLSAVAIENGSARYNSEVDMKQGMAKTFHRSMNLSGTVYFQESDEARNGHLVDLMQGQGFKVIVEDLSKIPKEKLLHYIVAPGMRSRIQRWEEFLKESARIESCLVDVEHNPNSRGASVDSDWPSMLTHGVVMDLSPNEGNPVRIATGLECFQALGYQMFPEEGSRWRESPLKNVLGNLSASQQKYLAGNGLHLFSHACFALYVLSHTIKTPWANSLTSFSHISELSFDQSDNEDEKASGDASSEASGDAKDRK